MEPARLKIAVVRPYLTVTKGGAERYAAELIRGLAEAGHRVHAFAYAWDKPEQPGVTYNKVAMPRKPAWLRVLCFQRNLRRQLRLDDFDVVLGLTPFSPQQVFWLGDGLYRAWVRISWPSAPLRWFMCLKRAVMAVNLAIERKILAPATAGFIANSNLVANQARQLYGVDARQIAVIYPWIDSARFNLAARARWRDPMRRQLGIGEGEIALLFAANNFKRKGLGSVLDALARIDRKAARLRLIVAGGGAVDDFRRKAKRLGLAERSEFLGAVGELERYYAAADIFVLPTRYDPCATVCLEAMACGLPVITTALNGAAEFIEQDGTGYVLPADFSPATLASRITAFAGRARCIQAGTAASERVRRLSTAAHLEQIHAALEFFKRKAQAPDCVQLEPGFTVNKLFLPLLRQHGLTSFSALLAAAKEHEIEYNQKKRIALLALPDGDEQHHFFLKAHRQEPRWLETAFAKYRQGAGITEWRNILALQSRGIPTAAPVAAGERVISDGCRESFVMTSRLGDYLPLDHLIAARFVAPLSGALRREKRVMIRAVADLARRLHGAGFNHQDFYLCHIFARIAAPGAPDLKLIDLQRTGHRRFVPRRWIVKDLAQLHYSSLDLPVSDRDRLRLLSAYLPGAQGRRQRRRMIQRVLRKSRAIAKHDAKLRARQPALLRDPFLYSRVPPDPARNDESL